MSYVRGPGVLHWHAITTGLAPKPTHLAPAASATYPTADLAIYVPVLVEHRVVVVKLFAANGSAASGNIDVGIYDAGGTKLVSSGQVTQSGTSTEQVFDVTNTTIGPGRYYLAVTLDNTTGTLIRDSDAAPLCAAHGVLSEQLGTGAALPATATWAVPQTLAYYPLIGMLLETTVS